MEEDNCYTECIECLPSCEDFEGAVFSYAMLRGVLGYSSSGAEAALAADEACKGTEPNTYCLPCDPFTLFLAYLMVSSRQCCAKEAIKSYEDTWDPTDCASCHERLETLLTDYFMCMVEHLNKFRCFLLPAIDATVPRMALYADAIKDVRCAHFAGGFWAVKTDNDPTTDDEPVEETVLGFAVKKCLMPSLVASKNNLEYDYTETVNDFVWAYTIAVLLSWWSERRLCTHDGASPRTVSFINETAGVLAGMLAGGLFQYGEQVAKWDEQYGLEQWIERLAAGLPQPAKNLLDSLRPNLQGSIQLLLALVGLEKAPPPVL